MRFASPIEEADVQRISRKFAREYPIAQDEQGVEVYFDVAKSQIIRKHVDWTGKKLSSEDQADMVFVRTNVFSCIRLAPYVGWEPFFERAISGWSTVTAVLSRRKVSRIGVRYINRLDIPSDDGQAVDIDDFLNVGPRLPAIGGTTSQYAFQATRPMNADGCSVTISSGIVPSPLVQHMSVTLDIDVFADHVDLVRDEQIWDLVTRIRNHKNRIFEASITDRARELFR